MTCPRSHRTFRVIVGLGLALGVPAGLGAPARAIHDVDHRYVVLGYVLDDAGRPLSGTKVSVVREETALSYPTETDAAGFYALIVHIHDEDVPRCPAGDGQQHLAPYRGPVQPGRPDDASRHEG